MKARKKMFIGIVFAIVFVTLICFFIFLRSELAMRIFVNYMIRQAHQQRVLLLCKTDHNALLKAGREILSQVPIPNRTRDKYRHGDYIPVPEGVRTPQTIRDLRARYWAIDYYGYLIIAMDGSMDHFGVNIYPDDFNEPYNNFKYGDRELIPGLWYYDERYRYDREYDKWIDELIEEYKKKREK